MPTAPASTPIETPLAAFHHAEGATAGTWFGCALPDRFSDDWQSEYRAARESVALLDKNYRAYLRFTGPDRGRYLNAILTNNIRDLAPGSGTVSLLLNPQGRIQAEIETYATDDSLFCVSYAMIRDSLVPALDKFIIMDDVTLTDETDKWGTVALEGPRAEELAKQLAGVSLAELQELSFCRATVNGIDCILSKRSPGGIASAEFSALREQLPNLWKFLRDAVTAVGGRPAGYKALNALRLEQGIPWFGYDFVGKQIPHEAGLENSHISNTKGCYTGQEIVERVRSRGQVNRVIVLLQLDGSEIPVSGTPLLADGKEVGHITRSTFSPALRAPIAMAYLRREQSAPGSQLNAGSSTATVISAPVASK
jgi:folate-binding protein YgfZ